MLRQSKRLLVKKKKALRKTPSIPGGGDQFIDTHGNVVDLTSYQQPKTAKIITDEFSPRPPSKYINRRRANRLKEFRDQQPPIPGGHMQPWNGYGFFNHNPNPVHDLTTEELEEYVHGTEYTELPEVMGKNEDWPRLPHDINVVETETTGFEHQTQLFKEEPWANEISEGDGKSRYHLYSGRDGYDIDLTRPGALEAYEADLEEFGELSHVPIRAAPQFEVINQVRWVDGKWVKTVDPNFKRAPHSAFLTDIPDIKIGTELLDPELDLGETGDGGYAAELARFGSLSNSSAGVDPSDVIDENDMKTINYIEGGIPSKGKVIDVTHTETVENITSGDGSEQGGGFLSTTESTTVEINTPEQQETDMFTDMMSVPGEEPIKITHDASITGRVNGIPINVFDNVQEVDPASVTTEHENHVFSGLYPRGDEEMTEFERIRLARCLEMHQKHNVPLANKGVDPYSNNAFLRRNNPFNNTNDDEIGRKHDLSVEFKLRQQYKLGYDVDKQTRPMYRTPETVASPQKGVISEWHRRILWTSTLAGVDRKTDLYPDGFIDGNGSKMYGDTKYTAVNHGTHRVGYTSLFHTRSQVTPISHEFVSQEKYQAYKSGEDLRRKMIREKELERKRAIKEEEYNKRISGKAEQEANEKRIANDKILNTMRMNNFTEDELILSEVRNKDIYLEDVRSKHQEDILSVYGRNPFKIDTRYLPWRGKRGQAWRDIPEDQLQLKGTGHFTDNVHSEGIFGYKHRRAEMDHLQWDSYSDTYRQRMWDHFTKKISLDNFLNDHFTADQLPKAGSSRETSNDLKVYHKYSAPGWAFRGRLDNSQIPPTEGSDYKWNTTPLDASGIVPTERPASTKRSVYVRKSDAEKFALSGQRRSYSSSARSHSQRRGISYHIQKDAEFYSSPVHRMRNPTNGFVPGEYQAPDKKKTKSLIPGDISGYHIDQDEDIPEDERLKRRQKYPGRNEATAEWPLNGTAAVVVGIEGVIQKGNTMLSGTQDAVRQLKARKIPLLFYSDGFPQWTEAEMATNLSQALQISISTEEVMLGCNSCAVPVIEEKHKTKHTLVVGPKGSAQVLKKAGFNHVVSVDRIAEQFSAHLPFKKTSNNTPGTGQYIIENIIITGMPADWSAALQICLDVLLTKQGQGVGSKQSLLDVSEPAQHVGVFVTDPRRLVSTSHEVPRIHSGVFVDSLRGLFENSRAGRALKITDVSRLNTDVQSLIEKRVLSLSKDYYKHTSEMTHIYNISDHIHHDAVAANRFRDSLHLRWWSVIVSTGISDDANTAIGHFVKHDLNDVC